MSEDAVAYVAVQREILAGISERDFLAQIVRAARVLGWMAYHPWNSMHSEAGYPDLTLIRNGQIIVAEVKREAGKLTPAQEAWLAAFRECGIRAEVWRPSGWDAVLEALQADSGPPCRVVVEGV